MTKRDIENLKKQWIDDPGWNLEEAAESPEDRQELLAFRLAEESKQQLILHQQDLDKADELGCHGNVALAQYIYRLEDRIRQLEIKLAKGNERENI